MGYALTCVQHPSSRGANLTSCQNTMAMQYSLQPSHTVDHRSNLLNDLSVGVSLPSYRKTRQLCRAFSLTVGYLGF